MSIKKIMRLASQHKCWATEFPHSEFKAMIFTLDFLLNITAGAFDSIPTADRTHMHSTIFALIGTFFYKCFHVRMEPVVLVFIILSYWFGVLLCDNERKWRRTFLQLYLISRPHWAPVLPALGREEGLRGRAEMGWGGDISSNDNVIRFI